MNQEQIFIDTEGDAWFERNKAKLGSPEMIANDWPLKLIEEAGLKPKTVCEVGCSNGWRLAEVWKIKSVISSMGIDPSLAAVKAGFKSNGRLDLRRDTIEHFQTIHCPFDLVIVYFVFHWIDRSTLLQSIANVDKLVKPEGHLIIGDFLPFDPIKVPYKHHEGLWTWKMDYPEIFMASGLYEQIQMEVFDHDDPMSPPKSSRTRASCCLMRKVLS